MTTDRRVGSAAAGGSGGGRPVDGLGRNGLGSQSSSREARMRLTGGQMIADYLISEGVEYVFAVPGHGNTALLDAFVDRKDEITVLPAMHEQGAAHMADGYYRSSGEIAVVITSMGPGATNALTGLTTAYADSIPFLLITGGAHTYLENRGLLQEIDRPHGNNFPAMAA